MDLPGKGTTVHLSQTEQRIVRFIAKQRSEANRRQGIVDARVGPQSSTELDIVGFGAEMAFGKMFNIYPDFSIEPRKGSADCIRFGDAIDVKATTYPNGRLLAVPSKELLAADVYALMIVNWAYKDENAVAEFRFAGFARAGELLTPERLTNLGHGPTYALSQGDLRENQLTDCPY